jgi:hypothetical protein
MFKVGDKVKINDGTPHHKGTVTYVMKSEYGEELRVVTKNCVFWVTEGQVSHINNNIINKIQKRYE